MLTVMLCGAADTAMFSTDFADEVRQFGGEPWFYQSGNITYRNAAHADWKLNSALSIQEADLCVFVLVRDYGRLTWDLELRAALDHGTPFLLLCLDKTHHRYLELTRLGVDRSALPASDLELLDLLHHLDATLNLTAVPFAAEYFRDILRAQLSNLFAHALRLMQQRNQRANVLHTLRPDQVPNEFEQRVLTEIAVDETEPSLVRKRAIRGLFPTGVNDADLRELIASSSQGVARLTIESLAELLRPDTDLDALLSFCVATVNDSDDVGLARRLVGQILDLDITEALAALDKLDLTEIGSRRRLAVALEAHEDLIRLAGAQVKAAGLLSRCLVKSTDEGWIARGKALLERLAASTAEPDRNA